MRGPGLLALVVMLGIAACSSKPPTDTGGTGTGGTTPKRLARMPEQHRGDGDQQCEAARPPGTPNASLSGCKADAECKDGKNGRCNERGGGHEVSRNDCEYDACFTDQDCPDMGTCTCAPTGNYCLPGNCRHDSDCGVGGACSPTRGCWRGPEGYYCHKADDGCLDDADCQQADPQAMCRYEAKLGKWACSKLVCPVG